MEAIMETTLAKWGNSQGFRVSKEFCDLLGIGIGSKVQMRVSEDRTMVTLEFERPARKYHRTRRVTIEELFEGWKGEKVGEEWGGPDVGAEVVE